MCTSQHYAFSQGDPKYNFVIYSKLPMFTDSLQRRLCNFCNNLGLHKIEVIKKNLTPFYKYLKLTDNLR